MHPRDWVVPMVDRWASQKRRLVYSRADGHVDGWNAKSLMGRLLEEGAGAGHVSGRVWQAHPEVYTGDALLVQRAIERMPELPRTVLNVHHVVREASAGTKADMLQLSRSAYYSQLDLSYYYLAGRIDGYSAANGELPAVSSRI